MESDNQMVDVPEPIQDETKPVEALAKQDIQMKGCNDGDEEESKQKDDHEDSADDDKDMTEEHSPAKELNTDIGSQINDEQDEGVFVHSVTTSKEKLGDPDQKISLIDNMNNVPNMEMGDSINTGESCETVEHDTKDQVESKLDSTQANELSQAQNQVNEGNVDISETNEIVCIKESATEMSPPNLKQTVSDTENKEKNISSPSSDNVQDTTECPTKQQNDRKRHERHETLEEIFPEMKKMKSSKSKTKRLTRKNIIKMSYNCCGTKSSAIATAESEKCLQQNPSDTLNSSIQETTNILSFDDINDLDFFCEVHEDQDPETIDLINTVSKNQIEIDLKNLSEDHEKMRWTTTQELKKSWSDQLQTFVLEMKRWKQLISDKQELQRNALKEQLNMSVKSKEKEAEEAFKMVHKKTAEKIEMINRSYQHYPTWNQELEQRKLTEINKHRAKANEMQNVINQKMQAYKNTKEADYIKNQEKLDKHHQKRKAELSLAISQKQIKLVERHRQQRIYVDNYHRNRFQTIKEKIINERGTLLRTGTKENLESNLVHESSQGDDSSSSERDQNKWDRSAAVLRYKRRQAVYAKGNIPTMLQVHIQNEGLGIRWRSNRDSTGEERTVEFEFLPWGFKARQLLHSISCGELQIDDNIFVESCTEGLLHGGQIKCIVSDFRDIDAKGESGCGSKEEPEKVKKLEQFISDLRQKLEVESRNEEQTEQDLARMHEKLNSLKYEANRMLQDTSVQLSNDRQREITSAFANYERLQQNQARTKKRKAQIAHGYQLALNEYQRTVVADNVNDSEMSKSVAEIKTAMNKRTPKVLAIDDFSSEPVQLEKGHLTIFLRPTKSRRYQDFRRVMEDAFNAHRSQPRSNQPRDINFDLLRAEELLLLGLYPASNTIPVTSAPTEHGDKAWAEPGSQLILDVTRAEGKVSTILPSRPNDKLFRQMNSEYASSKGHQASTLLNRKHLKNNILDRFERSELAKSKQFQDEQIIRSYEVKTEKQNEVIKSKHVDVFHSEDDPEIYQEPNKTHPSSIATSQNTSQENYEAAHSYLGTNKNISSTFNTPPINDCPRFGPFNNMDMQQPSTIINETVTPQVHQNPPFQYNPYAGATHHPIQPPYHQMTNFNQPPTQYMPTPPSADFGNTSGQKST